MNSYEYWGEPTRLKPRAIFPRRNDTSTPRGRRCWNFRLKRRSWRLQASECLSSPRKRGRVLRAEEMLRHRPDAHFFTTELGRHLFVVDGSRVYDLGDAT